LKPPPAGRLRRAKPSSVTQHRIKQALLHQAPLRVQDALWHNWQIGAPVKRSLIAYDH
jgi:hypothetical protein